MSGLAIAAPHALAVRAAARVADGGGNVVEAAVAAAAALTVVYPHQCSLGGDLFALLRFPDGTVRSVNSSGTYGTRPVAGLGPDARCRPADRDGAGHGRGVAVAPRSGRRECSAAADSGSRPSSSPTRARRSVRAWPAPWRMRAGLPTLDAGLRELLVRSDGTPVGVGDTLRQPRLAATLRDLADRGLRDFYQGLVGDRIAVAFDGLGIPVSRHDLADHEVVVESPLAVTAAGCRVMTSPPNSQGYLLLTSLLALDEYSRRRSVGGRPRAGRPVRVRGPAARA